VEILGLTENPQIQPAELAKRHVRRHHRIPARQREGGELFDRFQPLACGKSSVILSFL